MSYSLYPKQKEGSDFLRENKRGLLNFQMGGGKTLTAMDAALKLKLPVTIFTPPFLLKNWEGEIEKFKIRFPKMKLCKTSKIKDEIIPGSIWIVDEFHYFKNVGAQRTRTIFDLVKKYKPEFIFMLTGSPMLRSGEDLFTAFVIGNRDKRYQEFYNHFHFRETFTHKEIIQIGHKTFKKYSGLKNKELLQEIISPFLMKADLSEIVPVADFLEIYLDLGLGEQEELREAFLEYEGGVSAIKRECALEKCKATVEYAKKIFEENETPILIFSDHVESAEFIASALECDVITGKIAPEKRFEILANFKISGKFLVATIGSAGVGLSMENCKDVIFNDISWSFGLNSQAAARIRRANSTGILRCHFVIGGAADKMILDVVKAKEKNTKDLFNF